MKEKCCGAYPGYVCEGCPNSKAPPAPVAAAPVPPPAPTVRREDTASVNLFPEHGEVMREFHKPVLAPRNPAPISNCPSCQYPYGITPPVRAGLICGTCRRHV